MKSRETVDNPTSMPTNSAQTRPQPTRRAQCGGVRMHACIASLILAACAAPVIAQRAPEGWQIIDAGRADRGPLSTSPRRLPTDLRVPLSFDRVYRVPGATTGVQVPGAASGEELYARISGGLTAVFPRSEYVATKRGPAAVIPPGTVFYIGELPKPAPGATANPTPVTDSAGPTRATLTRTSSSASTRVDARADLAVTSPTDSVSSALDAPQPRPAIQPESAQARPRDLMGEAHRRDRVRTLMRLAARPG